ncbi:MAG: hypothetical protein J1E98_00035 [Lachnospiraceae bacterium]|nr:hypothetical protein [Lachnospiraceae bacterium]
MAYPKQLISSLADNLNKTLVDFFEIEHLKVFPIYSSLNDLIAETLLEYVKEETGKSELKSIHGTQVKMRRQKKNRWLIALEENIGKYEITNKKHPFYSVQHDYEVLPGHSFLKLYDAKDVDSAIKKCNDSITQWTENDQALLIEYPLISNKTKKQILSSFRIDLIINLIDSIITYWDGNIEAYFAKKPEILLDTPFFSPNRYSVPLHQSVDAYVADLISFDAENTVFQMLVSGDSEHIEDRQKVKVFDSKDNQILLTLLNNIKLDFYESKAITIEIGTLAKALNSRPNKHCYEDVKTRLHTMAGTTFRLYRKDNPDEALLTFNFFDNVMTPEKDGKEYAIVTFGNILFDAVTKKQMIAVTASSYNSLELDLSRLLYHNLQKERITLSSSSAPDENGHLVKSYDYSYFQRIILFKKRKKADNILLIRQTLDEFVDKKIALAKYEYQQNNGLFTLYFFNLTDDEKSDLIPKNYEPGNGTQMELTDIWE